LTATSTITCADRRPGSRRRTCSLPCPASERPSLAPDCRIAGIGIPRSPPDRGARRARAVDPSVRAMARQELHRRRPGQERARPYSWEPWSPPAINPVLKLFRDKLVAAGKPKLVALIALARKLSPSSTQSCETRPHGSIKRLTNKTVALSLRRRQPMRQRRNYRPRQRSKAPFASYFLPACLTTPKVSTARPMADF
jgi:hypothetical protein